MVQYVNGAELPHALQQEALRRFVHRYTGTHKPAWARDEWKEGRPYPVQFKDDADWLAHTEFPVTTKGRLSARPSDCRSRPTWPFNPELR